MQKNSGKSSLALRKRTVLSLALVLVFSVANIAAAVDVTDTSQLNDALLNPIDPLIAEINILNNIDLDISLIAQVTKELTILGDGIALSGEGLHSGFIVNNAGSSTNNQISIRDGVTLKNFYLSGNNGGSAIYNAAGGAIDGGIISIGNNVTVSGNSGGDGAILNIGSTTTMANGIAKVTVGDNATFTGNINSSTAGAIQNSANGQTSNANLTIGDNANISSNSGFNAILMNISAGNIANAVIDIGKEASISNNTISSGGTIFNQAVPTIVNGNATFGAVNIGDNSKITSNTITGNGSAIANQVYGNSSNTATAVVTIGNGVEFSDNSGRSIGGAISNYTSVNGTGLATTSTIIGNNSKFNNNSATALGGGILNHARSDGEAVSNITIGDNVTFSGNSSGTSGGAVYGWAYSTTNLAATSKIDVGNNAVFSDNTATGQGGAIYNFTQSTAGDSEINITGNALFTNNKDASGLNDIYMSGPSAVMNITGGSGQVVFESGLANSNNDAIINKNGGNNLVLGTSDTSTDFQFQTYTGTFNQTAGKTFAYGDFLGGVNNLSNSTTNLLATTSNVNLGKEFNLLGAASVNSVTGSTSNYAAADAIRVSGTNNFTIDVSISNGGTTGVSDNFYAPLFENAGGGILNVSGINMMGTPTAKVIPLDVFSYGQNDPVDFSQSVGKIKTPVYTYDFVANYGQPGGTYALLRSSIVPDAPRGQIATLAMYNSQLGVINTLFDHVYVDSPDFVAMGMQNKYAYSGSGHFAPYQFSENDGGLWTKGYASFETLSMTQGFNINNNLYGSIVGADFPPIRMKKGWKFLPTVFMAYNGGHQTYDGISMYQNGGQGGFMGTFFKKDFISSFLAYAGGYYNEMKGIGYNDDTGNWFAGTAVKAAYNFRPSRHIILQPSTFVSYNAFGEQNWHSDLGPLSMNSDMLNGINVAPGLNIIYARETWTAYITTLYTWNINDHIGGQAGPESLPSISMRHGWIEYGVGGTKNFKDRWIAWFQTTIRNGGRTGIALQLGLTWKF